jgi:fructoselysine 6-phosphate deglycase
MTDKPFPTEAQIAAALAAVKARATVTEVYFVACGGSYALMFPNQYAVDRHATTIAGHALNAAEFLARNPARLGPSSVVILCSHSGTTPETVEAAKFARSKGALTIALTNLPGSPLDQAVECPVYYTHAPKSFAPDHSPAVMARLTFGILAVREGNALAPKVDAALRALPALIDAAIAAHGDRIAAFAESHKREPVIYTMGAGANYATAYSYAICIFQEMQWIHSAGIHAGEYFHGPFEITDFDVPFIILRGLGVSRPMDDRSIAFATRFSQRCTILCAEELGLNVLDPAVVDHVEHMAFGTLLRVYCDKLADSRGHPLTVRRYMWKMDY